MLNKSLFFLSLLVLSVGFVSCEDDTDEDVGSSIQPKGDQLHTYSNMVSVSSSSMLVDSALSKSDYIYLGQYTDSKFGVVQDEFLTQLDARIGGFTLPDTSVATSSSSSSGIYYNLMNDIDSLYGSISSITEPENFTVDSVFFYLSYEDDFLGDSTALQALSVYSLNNSLPKQNKCFTNLNPTTFCSKDTLLGTLAYQVKNKRVLKVPLDLNYGKRLANVYLGNSSITSQAKFNNEFKGLYVSHSFNEGAIIKVSVAGVMVYYHYDANIHTTYNGNDTIVNTKKLSVNPLATSFFLSANKSVSRVNVMRHGDKSNLKSMAGNTEYTYTFTPSGIYTAVDIPFDSFIDSVRSKSSVDSLISFNSVQLKLFTKNLDWSTKLSKSPNSYMLLISKDSVVNFFYNNSTPDKIHSFYAPFDTTNNCYSFDISKAAQLKFTGKDSSLLRNMVVVPIYLSNSDDVYYYNQQLWPTAVQLYSSSVSDLKLRPRLDVIYTKREE